MIAAGVSHTFGDGPAIRSGFEIPLCGAEVFAGVLDVPLRRFEVLNSFIPFGLSEFVGAGGGTVETNSKSEIASSESLLHGWFLSPTI